MLVFTTRGLIERDRLEIKHHMTWTDNSYSIATEWYLDGEMVRRDVCVNILRGIDGESAAGSLG